jgi:hypothetical protein
LINGVPFEAEDGFMVAYNVSDEVAAVFAECDGYLIESDGKTTADADQTEGEDQSSNGGAARRGRNPKEVPAA